MSRTPCVIEGCDKPAHGGGYCQRHYNNLRNHGDPLWHTRRRCIVCGQSVPEDSRRLKYCSDECWGKADAAAMLIRTKRYAKAHPARFTKMKSESFGRWRDANLEYDRERKRGWGEKHPGYNWAASHRPQSRVAKARAQRRRRARIQGNGAYRVTSRDLSRLISRNGGRCAYCRNGFEENGGLQWDHVVPIARGGSDSIGNLLPSCRRCNQSKGALFVTEWHRNHVSH